MTRLCINNLGSSEKILYNSFPYFLFDFLSTLLYITITIKITDKTPLVRIKMP